jgi:hypothetical protein
LDGKPAYAGRVHDGHSVQGLLFNVRAVQATFDDANPETRSRWAYPDTGEWDPGRNVTEFCDALPAWRDHGVLAFTINVQGGGARYSPEVYDAYDNNGFTPGGCLKGAYAGRMARVLERADELGMVVIVGIFYWKHVSKLSDREAIWQAARETLAFLRGTGHQNVLVEIANETHGRFGYEIFEPEKAHGMINQLRAEYPEYLYSTSLVGADVESGKGMPPGSLVAASDYVLLHGNGNRAKGLEAAIKAVKAMPEYRQHPKPIVINEDSPGLPNLEVAWRSGVSWGYFDQGYAGAEAWGGDAYVDYQSKTREDRYEDLSGFQTPPVNWGINTALKRAFFQRVAEITGAHDIGSDES